MIPNDPIMLLSYVNTLLRDHYPNLDELCAGLNLDKQEIAAKLAAVNYIYDETLNKFI